MVCRPDSLFDAIVFYVVIPDTFLICKGYFQVQLQWMIPMFIHRLTVAHLMGNP